MGGRYWIAMAVRLVVAAVIVGCLVSYIGPGSGEKEFQKTLAAMKQVHSFRVAFSGGGAGQVTEMLWEIDCTRGIVHEQSHMVDSSVDPPREFNRDILSAAGKEYTRQPDGSWSKGLYGASTPGIWFCRNLAAGADSNLLPGIATMIRRGVIQKGDKKMVNGVRCREYRVTLKGGLRGLEHDTVCIGLADSLPYEMTVDWEGSRSTFSDYNKTLQFDLPEGAVETVSNGGTTN